MRTVGTLLQEERLRRNLTLEQVEKVTKIRAKFLKAIEADDYQKMPAFPYTQGFIKNYSNYLGLRSTTILAMFRRQYTSQEKEKDVTLEQPLTESSWQITPNKVMVVLVALLVLLLMSYFYSQYRALHAPPPLTLEQPKEAELIVRTQEIAVYGKTDTDATLRINNEPALVKNDGTFYKDIPVSIGSNTIIIEATSRVGEKTTVIRMVTRVPD